MVIFKHSPESCTAYNAKANEAVLELIRKQEARCKKHNVRIIEEYHLPEEHTIYSFYEVPNLQAFLNYNMEPEVLAMGEFETAETKIVFPMAKALKILEARSKGSE